jgi:hypothetical protein
MIAILMIVLIWMAVSVGIGLLLSHFTNRVAGRGPFNAGGGLLPAGTRGCPSPQSGP